MNPVAMTIINPRKEYWPSRGIEPVTSGSQVRNTTDTAMWLSIEEEALPKQMHMRQMKAVSVTI